MNPAWSVVVFTTAAGAGQGVVLALLWAQWVGASLATGTLRSALAVALVLQALGLAASFLHLGHPQRAWRAVLMWRTSWLSREVIVLPMFMAATGAWLWHGAPLGLVSECLMFALALLLWYCTAMIYACLRFVQEWAHGLTRMHFIFTGAASGAVVALAVVALAGEAAAVRALALWAAALLLVAWAVRVAMLRRNAALKPRSTSQSATGLPQAKLVQQHMGMTGGSFNTREFFHGASRLALSRVRWALHGLAYGLPLVCVLAGLYMGALWPWLLGCLSLVPGLLAERWLFFAQARHPQNVYYQLVS